VFQHAYEYQRIQNWAIHKKNPFIKAGLNNSFFKIPASLYDSLRKHTNSVEQSHHNANAGGKQLTLVEAIQK
jgi:hypothetical protein